MVDLKALELSGFWLGYLCIYLFRLGRAEGQRLLRKDDRPSME